MVTWFMWKLLQQLITNIWEMKSNWPALSWQPHICAARLGLWAPSSSLVGSQTASRQNQPAAPGEHSILLRLLFSLLTHIHPAWSACQTLRSPHHRPSFRHSPLPPLLQPSLPPLHWACEGEPVPSGATVQIAMRPLQMEASLLWIPM